MGVGVFSYQQQQRSTLNQAKQMNNNKIKAVFFDIDGTLVSFRTHAVPQSTQDAIARLRANGIKVFIASGRHKSYINNLGTLQFDGYVTVNGAMTWLDGEVIERHPMSKSDVANFCEYESKNPTPCAFVLDEQAVLNFENDDVREIFKLINFPQPPVGQLEQLKDRNVYQFIAFFGQDREAEIMDRLPNCVSTRWHPLFTDVVPKGISKVTGIQAVERHFGFSRENIMTFGDGGNDVEMLEYAGIGVAMGNAEESVKAKADYVTTSVDDDGVSRAIEKFLDI